MLRVWFGQFRESRRRPPVTAAASALLMVVTGMGTTAGVSLGAASVSAAGAAPAAALSASSAEGNVVTPGDFTGYGFDQCHAPDQRAMNRWLTHSPFLAVGIYISGNSRACRDQPNLTPTWISKQLAKGWRLLPITLGPQASCQPRFPRYDDDPKINPKRGTDGRYRWARDQGTAEATKAVAAAQALGIVAGSTLWYDLEGFNDALTDCRESALAFLSEWTDQLHRLGYVSGVYSSAGSGIEMLDDARVERPGVFTLPDRIWIARWDLQANTSTSYIRDDGWLPGGRMKQYQGGHDETWGGVRINIDRNYLDLGLGSVAPRETHCGGTRISYWRYRALVPGAATKQVPALQCLLKEKGAYDGPLSGTYDDATVAAASAWMGAHGLAPQAKFAPRHWVALLSAGAKPVLKIGSAGSDVRRLQRALSAADPDTRLTATGVFDARTDAALRAWQERNGLLRTGVAAPNTWKKLWQGQR
jgi:peptidoglycan hydrolase-like protein with peptidoglycan-binding domain